MSKSVKWFSNEQPDLEALVKLFEGQTLEECTVSNVVIEMERVDKAIKVRLYNTDPKNWNLFMFPYDAQKVRVQITVDVDKDPHQLQLALQKLTNEYVAETVDGLRSQIEIKNSASSGRLTLYLFNYTESSIGNTHYPFDYVDVEFSSIQDVNKIAKSGIPLASNVIDILKLVAGDDV